MKLKLIDITHLAEALQRAADIRMPFLLARWVRRTLTVLAPECTYMADEEKRLVEDYGGTITGKDVAFPNPTQQAAFLKARAELLATEVEVAIEPPPLPLEFDMSPSDDEIFDLVRRDKTNG